MDPASGLKSVTVWPLHTRRMQFPARLYVILEMWVLLTLVIMCALLFQLLVCEGGSQK
jgi:hypothetical protein